jgi:tellurite resistance protein
MRSMTASLRSDADTERFRWFIVVIARLLVTPRRVRQMREDMRHPMTGPFLAYVPVIALLLAGHYTPHLPPSAGAILVFFWVTVLAVVCAQMLAFWLSGALHLDHMHPGYALLVIAGPFIAAMTLSSTGYLAAGLAVAAAGAFYWLTLGTVIFLRLVQGPPLPAPLTPILVVLDTRPPRQAWPGSTVQKGAADEIQVGLAGVVTLFLITQAYMLRTYTAGHPSHLGWCGPSRSRQAPWPPAPSGGPSRRPELSRTPSPSLRSSSSPPEKPAHKRHTRTFR